MDLVARLRRNAENAHELAGCDSIPECEACDQVIAADTLERLISQHTEEENHND